MGCCCCCCAAVLMLLLKLTNRAGRLQSRLHVPLLVVCQLGSDLRLDCRLQPTLTCQRGHTHTHTSSSSGQRVALRSSVLRVHEGVSL